MDKSHFYLDIIQEMINNTVNAHVLVDIVQTHAHHRRVNRKCLVVDLHSIRIERMIN